MANHESSQSRAESQENEPILGALVRIINEDGSIVEKDRLSLLERNAMLSLIRGALAGIPLKVEVGHRSRV